MYIIVILNAQCNIYAFMAGFVVCLHTLNLGKDYEPYISVVVFRKIPPYHQYTTLAPNVVVTFGRTSPVDRRFEGGSLVATNRRTRELGEKEIEVWLRRADVLVSLERKRWKFGCDEQTNS